MNLKGRYKNEKPGVLSKPGMKLKKAKFRKGIQRNTERFMHPREHQVLCNPDEEAASYRPCLDPAIAPKSKIIKRKYKPWK